MVDALQRGGAPSRRAASRRAQGGVSDARAARARELHRKALEADELAARQRAERDALIRRLRAEDPKKWSYLDNAERAARIAIKAASDEDRPQVDLATVAATRGDRGESQRIGQAIISQHDDEGPLELDDDAIDLLLSRWHAPDRRRASR